MKLFEISKKILSKKLQKNNFKIPLNIYQTWESNKVPKGMYDAINTWIKLNPEYTYNLYDSQDRLKYIINFNCDNFSFNNKELLYCYNNMVQKAAKADIWRYLILYDKGGIYTDIDTECLIPLKEYIKENDEFLNGLNNRGQIYQTFIFTKQKHPFLKELIELVVYNIINKSFINEWEDLKSLTGPTTINYAIKKYLDLLTPLEKDRKADINNQFKFEYNIDIIKKHKVKFIPKFTEKYINFQYKNYKEETLKLNLPHWQGNNKNQIFLN
tara:strand:- start:195 stop:1004 length:810 start_codon:yes stop_codon:yes gene_type:complete